MQLHTIPLPKGAHKRRKIVGRGRSSGHGKTSCRGQTGQKSRTGYSSRPGFEGGQMPLIRRVPKRGFTSSNRQKTKVINISDLARLSKDSIVSLDALREQGILKEGEILKILGEGKIERPLTVNAHKFSSSAKEKITKAGGKAEIVSANK